MIEKSFLNRLNGYCNSPNADKKTMDLLKDLRKLVSKICQVNRESDYYFEVAVNKKTNDLFLKLMKDQKRINQWGILFEKQKKKNTLNELYEVVCNLT